jgi:hypothetical protein
MGRNIKNGAFSERERLFIQFHGVEGKERTESARLAGYGNPSVMACRLLDPTKNPKVCLAVQQERDKHSSVQKFSADDVLRVLQVGAFLDPRPFFLPGSIDGQYWTISEEDYQKLPLDIARHVKYAEREVTYVEDNEGVVTAKPTGILKVKLTDKEALISVCSKAMLGEKVNVSGHIMQLNWADLQRRTKLTDRPEIHDALEAEILAVKDSGTDLLNPSSIPTAPVSADQKESADSIPETNLLPVPYTPPGQPTDLL